MLDYTYSVCAVTETAFLSNIKGELLSDTNFNLKIPACEFKLFQRCLYESNLQLALSLSQIFQMRICKNKLNAGSLALVSVLTSKNVT